MSISMMFHKQRVQGEDVYDLPENERKNLDYLKRLEEDAEATRDSGIDYLTPTDTFIIGNGRDRFNTRF